MKEWDWIGKEYRIDYGIQRTYYLVYEKTEDGGINDGKPTYEMYSTESADKLCEFLNKLSETLDNIL